MKDRITYIDIAKGIGIFFVIWGHIILNGPGYNFIYAFHMPLFFFLSGLVFSDKKYESGKEFIKKRLKTLILPYIIWSIVTYLYWVLVENRFAGNANIISPFIQIFISQGSSGYMLHNIPMWFVLCLFLVEIIYYYICKIKNFAFRRITILSLGIIGCIMTLENSFFDFTKLFWSAEIALVALPFYWIGNEISNKFDKVTLGTKICDRKILSIAISVILFSVLLITSNLNPDISMGSDKLGNWLLFYINAILGIILIMLISIMIKSNDFLEFLGKHSFFIMATHFPVRKPIVLLFGKIFGISSKIIYSSIIYSFIIAILTLFIEIVIIKVISRKEQLLK